MVPLSYFICSYLEFCFIRIAPQSSETMQGELERLRSNPCETEL